MLSSHSGSVFTVWVSARRLSQTTEYRKFRELTYDSKQMCEHGEQLCVSRLLVECKPLSYSLKKPYLRDNEYEYTQSLISRNIHLIFSFVCFRVHRNDMENIVPFLFLGAVYSLIGPSLAVARAHFLVFFLFRVLHTVAYLCVLRAPTRSLAYVVAQVPCVSMAVQVLAAVASSW